MACAWLFACSGGGDDSGSANVGGATSRAGSSAGGAAGAAGAPGAAGAAAGGSGGGAGAATPPLPQASGADRPMTCEWLDGDNCWKQVIADVDRCKPAGPGTFSADGATCSFSDGSQMTWSGFENFNDATQFENLIVYTPQRLAAADGSTCLEIRTAGWADYAVISGDTVVVYDSLSATSFRVICGDGSSYSSEVEGACGDLPARGFAGTSPSFRGQFTRDGQSSSAVFGGSVDGPHAVWTCERPD